MFTENNCPLFVLKRKIPNEWMGRLEAWHSRHFTASSSQALILHEKTSQPLGTNSGKADEFWWVARGRYPHLPKKLTYRSPPVREGPPNPTRTHSSSHTRGCFRCEGFVLGRVLFSFNQELQGLHKNKRKIQGLCWPVRSSKQIDPLATWPFLHGIEKKAEASCYRGKLTWLKRTALQTGMLNPWLKSNWRNKRSYYERPKHHRNQGQISFALKEVAQLTIAYSFDQAFSYRLVS